MGHPCAAARAAVDLISSANAVRSGAQTVRFLAELQKNEARLIELSRDGMLKTALELVDRRSRPVCASDAGDAEPKSTTIETPPAETWLIVV